MSISFFILAASSSFYRMLSKSSSFYCFSLSFSYFICVTSSSCCLNSACFCASFYSSFLMKSRLGWILSFYNLSALSNSNSAQSFFSYVLSAFNLFLISSRFPMSTIWCSSRLFRTSIWLFLSSKTLFRQSQSCFNYLCAISKSRYFSFSCSSFTTRFLISSLSLEAWFSSSFTLKIYCSSCLKFTVFFSWMSLMTYWFSYWT